MIICLCGKSGAGKSTIANLINEKITNTYQIDIDKIGHMVNDLPTVQKALLENFGSSLLKDGKIDRKKLGHIVFNDKEKMDLLTKITWNEMDNYIKKEIEDNKNKVIILDWQLIYKTHYFDESDIKILIDVPYKTRLKRVMLRDNITEEKFKEREKASVKYQKNKFDFIVNTSKESINNLICYINRCL